jgi:ABC-type uncharacterized transport system substrate-binding protein
MLRSTIQTLTVVACSAGAAQAHPHVFVDAEVRFVLSDETLTSLRVSWTYDAFTSLVLFEALELDQDGDGVLSAADLAVVAAGETEWPEGYKGDVYLEVDDLPIQLDPPSNASADVNDERISVHFDMALASPLDLSDEEAVLRFYDPLFFYAYTATQATMTGLQGTACRSEIQPFEPDAATARLQRQLAALSREETPEQADVGRLFADLVVLSCR